MKLYFATTNKHKAEQMYQLLQLEGLEIETVGIESIEEIQSNNLSTIAIEKAKAHYNILKKPVFCEDVSFHLSALRGFPGPYIKDFQEHYSNLDIIDLVTKLDNREAKAVCTLVYYDSKPYVFIGETLGTISDKPRGDKDFGWGPIFIPDGYSKTYAEMEMSEKREVTHRAKAAKLFKEWLAANLL